MAVAQSRELLTRRPRRSEQRQLRTVAELEGVRMTGAQITCAALEAEGAAQKASGKAQRKTSGAFHEAKGSVKAGVGDMIDSPSIEAEGEAEKLRGKAERL